MATWVLIIIVLGGELPAVQIVEPFTKETCQVARDAVTAAVKAEGRGYSAVAVCVERRAS